MTTTTTPDLDGLARSTFAAYLRTREEFSTGLRPIDRKLAEAKLHGYLGAISALGLAMTPFAAEMALADAVTQADEPRPLWRAIDNSGLRAWDAAAAARFATILGWDL